MDDKENLWISDTATSNFLKFEPDTQIITKYPTSFPRQETFGNASGLIKTPITRPYWNSIVDGKLIFNEQQSNMLGIFDLNSEKLVEYLIPSKNPNWADCEEGTDCGLAQVFGFTKADEKIWFTEWVENNIGVLDLSVKLPVDIQIEPKILTLQKGDKSTILLKITPNENYENEIQISSSTIDSNQINVVVPKEKTTTEISETFIQIEISEQIESGTYKILIGAIHPDVTVSKFITVNVL